MIFKPNKPGQSLTEYALPIALVVLVGVGLLGALGSQLNNLFGNAIGLKSSSSSSNGQSSTLASLPPPSNGLGGTQVIQSGFVPTPNSNTLSFDIAENGKTLHLSIPNYPDSLKTGVETVGADGTTQRYSATLKTLADKLEEEGILTPDKAQMIRDIANNGFDLSAKQAELQKSLADAPQNGGALLFPSRGSDTTKLEPVSPVRTLFFVNQLNILQKNVEKAKVAGALNNPILQRVVLDAVSNLKLSGSFSANYVINAIDKIRASQAVPPQYSKYDLDNFLIRQSQIQETTLKEQAQGSIEDSTKICDASGKSKVEGLYCKPAQPKETAPPEKALFSPRTVKPTPSQMGNLASDFNLKKP